MRYSFVAFLILALSFALNFKQVAEFPSVVMLRQGAHYSLYPFEIGFSIVIRAGKGATLFFANSFRAQSRIKELELVLKTTKAELSSSASLKEENQRLKEALKFSETGFFGRKLIPANVLARENKNFSQIMIIDAGSLKQITPGMTVVSSYGLVGRVAEVSKFTSKIILVTSPQSSISAYLPHVNAFGVIKGNGGNRLELEYIGENISVETTTPVIVSSVSDSFVQGVLIGKVLKVERNIDDIFQKIHVEPATDFSKLGVVFICKP
ncbi:rod shape-determining protein MreC [Candidatus Saganbacteria bacterium]|nr:rod shape-determining protein MreC [Candidatus Saganbacteria bacterium]